MSRVVIVGAGMAGARLAEEITGRDTDGRIHLTVLGAEPHRPYNRVQLTNVLAGGVKADDIVLPMPGERAIERLGTEVRSIDRARRLVRLADGGTVGYDELVLATGAEPMIPPVAGARTSGGALRPGVFTFRTLDDCRALQAAASDGARRAIVVGGGVLGLETARGLAGRGLAVTVVHMAPRLMERQLDTESARILRATYADLGIEARVNATAAEVTGGDRVDGLVLDTGEWVPADLVVFSCGIIARTRLAEECDLEVDRGIVVGDDLRTNDPSIYAIGDCARHKGTVGGLIDPAWEQAKVLAERLTGPDTEVRYTGSPQVTRLKAKGIELVAMGDVLAGDEAADVVMFSDAGRRTYKKLVMRGERLIGAVLVGDDETSGLVTQLFDRGARVPADPKALLFRGLRTTRDDDGGPSQSDDTKICRCNGVTRGAIVSAYTEGAHSVEAMTGKLRTSTGCGSCRDQVAAIIAEQPDHADVGT